MCLITSPLNQLHPLRVSVYLRFFLCSLSCYVLCFLVFDQFLYNKYMTLAYFKRHCTHVGSFGFFSMILIVLFCRSSFDEIFFWAALFYDLLSSRITHHSVGTLIMLHNGNMSCICYNKCIWCRTYRLSQSWNNHG